MDMDLDLCRPCRGPQIVEIKQKSTGWKLPHHKKSMYQPYQGKVKLDVEADRNKMVVNVDQAEHLQIKTGAECMTYARVSLVPGHIGKQRTVEIEGSNKPVFKEQFEFHIEEEDYKKRLLVSLWKQAKGKEELLGCMSFGILSILQKQKEVSGWYYLLTEELGRYKHLQVKEDSSESVSKDNTFKQKVTIERGERGFGFTMAGANPVRVSKVQPFSPAEDAGLQKGDQIIKINRYSVRTLPSHSVARIIRIERKVTLTLRRANKPIVKTPVIKKVTFQDNATILR